MLIFLCSRIVIDMLRKGAVTSITATELGFVGFLWVVWLGESFRVFDTLPVLIHSILACASNATAALLGLSLGDCSLYDCEFLIRRLLSIPH